MNAVLEIEALSAGYDGVPVVRGLDLQVQAGQVVALLGPNGAGKTTTLAACSGLLPAIAGEVRFRGKRVSTRRPHRLAREGLAHVPEDRAVFREPHRASAPQRDPAPGRSRLAVLPLARAPRPVAGWACSPEASSRWSLSGGR